MSAAKSCLRYSVRRHYEFTGADGPVRPNRACANFPTIIYRQAAHRGRPPGRPETGLAPHLMQKTMSLRGRTAPVAIRASRLRSCLRRLPFFLRRKKGRKERRQNQGFGILSAAEVLIVSVPSCPANRSVQNSCRAFVSPLRLPPRRTLCLCWLSKRGHILHLPRVAMWASPPTKFYR